MDITIGLAFLAGLASFLSPCVFSLVPAYVGYLSGRSISASGEPGQSDKWITLLHGIAFILGFSVIFIALGITISVIGSLLYDLKFYLAKVGGVIVILFGLHMTGLLRISFLDYELKPQSKGEQRRGFLSSFLMGVFFSAGWSPCVGPVLGSILTIALNQGSISQGVSLLGSYSMGMAIPFLLAASGIGWVMPILKKYKGMMHSIEIGMGILLIVVGIMLFLGIFEQLARLGFLIDFGI